MDEQLRILIREWLVSPEDETLTQQLDAALARMGWISTQDYRDIKTAATEILSHKEQDFNRPAAVVARFLEEANTHIDVVFHKQEDPYEFFTLSEAVYALLPHPTFPEDRNQLNHPGAFEAALRLAGCSDCLQYVQGCLCEADLNYLAPENRHNLPVGFPFICPGCNTRVARANNAVGFRCNCPPCPHCHQFPCACDYHTQMIGGNYAVMAHDDPSQCACRGTGWSISDFDSIHRCMIHPVTAHHPDCGNPGSITECCALQQYRRNPVPKNYRFPVYKSKDPVDYMVHGLMNLKAGVQFAKRGLGQYAGARFKNASYYFQSLAEIVPYEGMLLDAVGRLWELADQINDHNFELKRNQILKTLHPIQAYVLASGNNYVFQQELDNIESLVR